jgi:hypothetical protein
LNKIRQCEAYNLFFCTYEIATEGIVYLIHRAGECMQLSARLATLLELTLQSTKYMVEGEPTFAGRTHTAAHPAHPSDALLGELGPALSLVPSEIKCS